MHPVECKDILSPQDHSILMSGVGKMRLLFASGAGQTLIMDTQTRHSVSGYVVYLEDSPIMHKNVTQKTVALSSCKAGSSWLPYVYKMCYNKNTLELIGL
jgi:hypothetical protein